jgi:hypothetical protein
VHGAGRRFLHVLDGHPCLPFPHAGYERPRGRSPLARHGALIIVSLEEGLISEMTEETIRSIGYIGRAGMHPTDVEILNIMIGKMVCQVA